MTKEELKEQFPELFAAVLEDGRAEALAAQPKSVDAAAVLNLLKPLMSAENFAVAESYFGKASAAGLTFEQMAAMSGMLQPAVPAQEAKHEQGADAAEAVRPEQDVKSALLKAIAAATPSGVAASAEPKTAGDALMKAAGK